MLTKCRSIDLKVGWYETLYGNLGIDTTSRMDLASSDISSEATTEVVNLIKQTESTFRSLSSQFLIKLKVTSINLSKLCERKMEMSKLISAEAWPRSP